MVELYQHRCEDGDMTAEHALWEAIGNLHRARHELIEQLTPVVREGGDHACSFCHSEPPDVAVLVGPSASICDRCVELCREILAMTSSG